MIKAIDYFLDRITMYRLVLYYLIVVLLVAVGLGQFNLLPYTPLSIIESSLLLTALCLITNRIFAWTFKAPVNVESAYITALIIACIIPPLRSIHDIPLLFWAGVWAMASKYIFAIRNKHIFNPVAIAVVLTGMWLDMPAIWWVGTTHMAWVILLGGLLVVRKIRRADLVFAFFVTALLTTAYFSIAHGTDLITSESNILLKSSLLFFAFVMLTEPLTTPPTTGLQIAYGGLVGFLFSPYLHVGTIYSTPELALVVGNVFSYLVSPKFKERLSLIGVRKISADVAAFDFQMSRPISYKPGQYMEFTLPHKGPDARGNRRYFTLASSPTEATLQLGIRFSANGSSFKHEFLSLTPGSTLMAGQLAGDFVLPDNKTQKLAFIAGGIGVTPFRSMLKYLIDTNQARNISVLYSNKSADEIAYVDVFNEAQTKLGIRTQYILTETIPDGWQGRQGRLDAKMLQEEIPDFLERVFYISGPQPMVAGVEQILHQLGVKQNQIKKDFFPGLA